MWLFVTAGEHAYRCIRRAGLDPTVAFAPLATPTVAVKRNKVQAPSTSSMSRGFLGPV